MTSAPAVRHPFFARFYTRVASNLESKGAADHRQEALAGLTGRVVEVGAGNGLNFKHYPSTVTEVIAVEPEAFLRARATEAAENAAVPIHGVDGTGRTTFPLDDATVDGAVASLVLCSVPDPQAALAELRRVLRPSGELRFLRARPCRQPALGTTATTLGAHMGTLRRRVQA